jgi:ubiquinone/menaquinone biosynthesis C-methylase UbiE
VEIVMKQETAPRTHGLVIDGALRYDLLAWLFTHGRERQLRERIIALAGLKAGEDVLDIGCGTGTLAIAAARPIMPGGVVCGIDASPSMIARARRKASKAGVDVDFQVAVAENLPFPDGRFDVVLSTLMLHHLPRKTRHACAMEIRRVLKTGGRVLAVDFSRGDGRGLLAHFHRHGHVDVGDIVTLLTGVGLTVDTAGPVRMNDLHFVLAEKSANDPS